jgi:3-dehydroquinate synthetase
VSAAVGVCESSLADRVTRTVQQAGLPADLDRWLRGDVLDRIAVDKKRAGDHVDFIAVRAPGDAYVTSLSLGELRSFLRPLPSL